MENNNTGSGVMKWVIGAIVIVILVVAAIFGFGRKDNDNTDGTDASLNGDVVEQTLPASGPGLVISDQYPGTTVYLPSVAMDKDGWVVIHADNKGKPGAIIGSAWFAKGTGPSKVTITSPIVDGGTYYAMLHTDDGDKAFDHSKDLPTKDAEGDVVVKMFRGSTGAGSTIKG